ncbi:hypothetical protein [Larsenimonas suaedae]|uniref:Uncharacterized protein n=1 Tax=Larsenimonas suaedae TaxID=1851019 RepID=A0ABU1GZ19_9GAMM|nr:hypothetical protein [Larsenimonas suaedae]MCM2973762.1 hypothetical protein [Larsenimonas suaedae]MDR5897286.1 hypothetical protein [Larsenimonas suaedae]
MTQKLQFDPRTKQQIKDKLHDTIYGPMEQKFETRLHGIIRDNTKLLRSSYFSFIYDGQTYVLNGQEILPRRMNRLHESLTERMDEYLADLNRLNAYEMPYVLGYITSVLNTSDNINDYIKLLPEPLHQPLQELIDSCGCRISDLSDARVEELRARHEVPIQLIRERFVLNLVS